MCVARGVGSLKIYQPNKDIKTNKRMADVMARIFLPNVTQMSNRKKKVFACY